jgi:hypothetical protein
MGEGTSKLKPFAVVRVRVPEFHDARFKLLNCTGSAESKAERLIDRELKAKAWTDATIIERIR